MFRKIKLILVIFLFVSFFNPLFAQENFFEEAKNKFNAKKLEILNFYFKEILYLTQKMQNLIYI